MTAQGPARRDAAYFDQWYADMAESSARDAIVTRAMGLPPEVPSTGVLPWQGVADLVHELRLPPGGLLLDIACGRGGYGVEVARRTGTRLIGVDFSAVAVQQARATSAPRLPTGRSEFRVGTLRAVAAADSDAAVRSLRAEGRRALETFDSLRRVFATATAP